jgi:pSer/pThr/pTyr-binding forkhead associated (FHA) protein
MRVVIDHVVGSRRGQRQELPADARVRFGRHPDCEVAFDPVRDLDASSRHAELRPVEAGGWVLVDIGSSNGTYVDGRRVTEAKVPPGVPLVVEFGHDGPQIRLFVGEPEAAAQVPPPVVPRRRPRWLAPAAIAAGVLIIALVLALLR